MSVTPEKDPNYIYAHPYATLIADEYRMRGGYCIVRPGGTDDHLAFEGTVPTGSLVAHPEAKRSACGGRARMECHVFRQCPKMSHEIYSC